VSPPVFLDASSRSKKRIRRAARQCLPAGNRFPKRTLQTGPTVVLFDGLDQIFDAAWNWKAKSLAERSRNFRRKGFSTSVPRSPFPFQETA
jgi:hypothetical protein